MPRFRSVLRYCLYQNGSIARNRENVRRIECNRLRILKTPVRTIRVSKNTHDSSLSLTRPSGVATRSLISVQDHFLSLTRPSRAATHSHCVTTPHRRNELPRRPSEGTPRVDPHSRASEHRQGRYPVDDGSGPTRIVGRWRPAHFFGPEAVSPGIPFRALISGQRPCSARSGICISDSPIAVRPEPLEPYRLASIVYPMGTQVSPPFFESFSVNVTL